MSDERGLGEPNSHINEYGVDRSGFRPKKPNPFIASDPSKGLSSRKLPLKVTPDVPAGFVYNVFSIADDLANILIKKQADYGPHNVGRAPGGPLNGLIVRIHDKISRIVHLTNKNVDPQNESLRDSYIDLANYAIIALMVLDGKWPKE